MKHYYKEAIYETINQADSSRCFRNHVLESLPHTLMG